MQNGGYKPQEIPLVASFLQPPTSKNDLLKCQTLASIFVSLTGCSLAAVLTSIELSGEEVSAQTAMHLQVELRQSTFNVQRVLL